jgi:hypothetical protein
MNRGRRQPRVTFGPARVQRGSCEISAALCTQMVKRTAGVSTVTGTERVIYPRGSPAVTKKHERGYEQ